MLIVITYTLITFWLYKLDLILYFYCLVNNWRVKHEIYNVIRKVNYVCSLLLLLQWLPFDYIVLFIIYMTKQNFNDVVVLLLGSNKSHTVVLSIFIVYLVENGVQIRILKNVPQ